MYVMNPVRGLMLLDEELLRMHTFFFFLYEQLPGIHDDVMKRLSLIILLKDHGASVSSTKIEGNESQGIP